MKYRKLGKTGLEVSVIGFGCWAIGGHGYGPVEDSQSIRAIWAGLDLGVNLFDTADVYGFGHSEEVLTKALGPRIREVVIATKFGVRWDETGRTWKDCSVKYLTTAIENSLRRLKTDCITLYQLHWYDGVTPLTDVLDALSLLQSAGKIRHFGISNIPANHLSGLNGVDRVSSAQIPFSIICRDSFNEMTAFRESYEISAIVYGVLERGGLTGKYHHNSIFGEKDTRSTDSVFRAKLVRNCCVAEELRRIAVKYGMTPAQVAISWTIEYPGVTCVLTGVKSETQISENVGATDLSLDLEDWKIIDRMGTEHFEVRD